MVVENAALRFIFHTPSFYLIESRMLSFVIAEEDLRIETSYPFNEVTAVFLLNNPCYHLVLVDRESVQCGHAWESRHCLVCQFVVVHNELLQPCKE